MNHLSLPNPFALPKSHKSLSPKSEDFNLAWNLLIELRKETLETQKIRAQAVGFKITFVSTLIGLIVASNAPIELLVIPAFSAIFFDILIVAYTITIKRIGLYCRSYLEPILKQRSKDWTSNSPLWEEFLKINSITKPSKKICPLGSLQLIGNIGLTSLTVFPAISVLLQSSNLIVSLPIVFILVSLLIYDIRLFLYPLKIIESDP